MPLDSPYHYRWPFFPQPTSLFVTFWPQKAGVLPLGPSLTIWNISGIFPWFLETTYFCGTNAYFFSHPDLTLIVHSIRAAQTELEESCCWEKISCLGNFNITNFLDAIHFPAFIFTDGQISTWTLQLKFSQTLY